MVLNKKPGRNFIKCGIGANAAPKTDLKYPPVPSPHPCA